MDLSTLIECLSKFGGYVFKPVTLAELKDSGVADFNFNEISADDTDPFYIIGFAANVLTCDIEVPPMLISIDSFPDPLPPPYLHLTPTSFVSIYGTAEYASQSLRKNTKVFKARHLQMQSTQLLEGLIKVAGVARIIEKYTDYRQIELLLEGVSYEYTFSAKKDAPVEKPAVVLPVDENLTGNVSLTRKEIMELLKTERECVIRAGHCDRNCARCDLLRDPSKLIAMYDSVIKIYGRMMKQNADGKNVRMADGSRKWFSNEEAEALLKIPVNQRLTTK